MTSLAAANQEVPPDLAQLAGKNRRGGLRGRKGGAGGRGRGRRQVGGAGLGFGDGGAAGAGPLSGSGLGLGRGTAGTFEAGFARGGFESTVEGTAVPSAAGSTANGGQGGAPQKPSQTLPPPPPAPPLPPGLPSGPADTFSPSLGAPAGTQAPASAGGALQHQQQLPPVPQRVAEGAPPQQQQQGVFGGAGLRGMYSGRFKTSFVASGTGAHERFVRIWLQSRRTGMWCALACSHVRLHDCLGLFVHTSAWLLPEVRVFKFLLFLAPSAQHEELSLRDIHAHASHMSVVSRGWNFH